MKKHTLSIILAILITGSLKAQTYTNPTHLVQEINYNQTLGEFDNLSRELEKRAELNDSIQNILIVLQEMKKSKISSMSQVPMYYTDPVRIKRFNEKVITTRSIINHCKELIVSKGKYRYFEQVFTKMQDRLEEVESNWKIVTEFKGEKRLMDAHQRYKLALYAEQGLNEIARDAVNYSRIAYAITRSREEAVEDNKRIMNGILNGTKGIE